MDENRKKGNFPVHSFVRRENEKRFAVTKYNKISEVIKKLVNIGIRENEEASFEIENSPFSAF